MLPVVLFTVFALLCMLVAAYCAWHAHESAHAALHSEHRLAIMRGQVAGLEAAMTALDSKHAKLAGRVYADEYWRGKPSKQPELQPAADEPIGGACENWTAAQQKGPLSTEAQCMCEYCTSKRDARARARATLRPPAMARR